MTTEDTTTTPAATPDDDSAPRRGLWQRIRSRPVVSSIAAAGALAVLLVVLLWFQPQTLFFDNVVDEDFPVVAPTEDADPAEDAETATQEPTADDDGAGTADMDDADAMDDVDDQSDTEDGAGDEPEEPTEPVALASGEFTSLNRYTVVGEATTYELPDGSRVLRLEDFESTNGPDLYVYLSAAGADDGDAALDVDAVNLGVLSGNIGNQNYEIPDDVDLDHYDTVVIWCLRFTTGFGAADLTPR